MTLLLIIICVLSQICLAGGQIFLKHAMNFTHRSPLPWARFLPIFGAGIAAMTCWFFLWTGVLQNLNLSYVYPFAGLSPVLLVLGAALFLKEKLSLRTCIAIALIAGGIALVSAS